MHVTECSIPQKKNKDKSTHHMRDFERSMTCNFCCFSMSSLIQPVFGLELTVMSKRAKVACHRVLNLSEKKGQKYTSHAGF